MINTILIFLLILFPTALLADPLAAGDVKIGKALVEKNCIECHVRLHGGDGSKMYTRPDRKVTSSAKLLAQIAICNAQLGTQWFPEDEVHVAAYLNQTYYKFPSGK
jgi:cytochrome c